MSASLDPATDQPDGSHQSSRRRFPTAATGLFNVAAAAGSTPVAQPFYATGLPDDAISDVDWVTGRVC